MEKFKEQFRAKFQDIKLTQVIYGAISFVLIVITVVLFTLSTRNISQLLNDAIDSNDTSSGTLTLDMEDLDLVAHKLNITQTTGTTTAPVTPIQTPVVSAEATTTSAEPALNKNTLRISIQNSTKTPGLAAKMRTLLEKNGFSVSSTGNTNPEETGVVLKIKPSKEAYRAPLRDALANTYQVTEVRELSESDANDAIIIIGR